MEQIEKVQRRATKMMHTIQDMPYQKRLGLQYKDLPSLVYRIYCGDMIEVGYINLYMEYTPCPKISDTPTDKLV